MMKLKIKGQVSIEIVLIVSFVIFLFIPLILSSYSKATEVEANSKFQRESYFLYEMQNNAELVYSTALQSEVKKTIYVPYSVSSIYSKSNGYTTLVVKDDNGNELTSITKAKIRVDSSLSNLDKKGSREFLFKKEYDSINDEYFVSININ